jgi:hypothetical protein
MLWCHFKRNLNQGRSVNISINGNFWRKMFLDKRGNIHRIGGPAVIWDDGCKNWYVEGKFFTEEQYNYYILWMKDV